MSRVLKSKANIRKQIIFALSHGTDRRNPNDKGIIEKLLKRVSQMLDSDMSLDPDVLAKLITGVVRLSAIAMPTAYQAEALDKGLTPGAAQGVNAQDLFALIERQLEQRRLLLAPQQTQVIDVTPKSTESLKTQAMQELCQRLTPPPVPPPGLVVGKLGERGPTPPQISSAENITGTKLETVSINFNDLPADPLPDMDIEI